MIGGLIIMLGCCGTPRGVNHNDKTVMINPPGHTTMVGLMKTLHRFKRIRSTPQSLRKENRDSFVEHK